MKGIPYHDVLAVRNHLRVVQGLRRVLQELQRQADLEVHLRHPPHVRLLALHSSAADGLCYFVWETLPVYREHTRVTDMYCMVRSVTLDVQGFDHIRRFTTANAFRKLAPVPSGDKVFARITAYCTVLVHQQMACHMDDTSRHSGKDSE